jgi:hypothetical protein
MKLWNPPCLLALLALFQSACSSTGLQRLALVTGGQHTIHEDMPGDLVVLGGSVTLPSGAALQGSLYLLRFDSHPGLPLEPAARIDWLWGCIFDPLWPASLPPASYRRVAEPLWIQAFDKDQIMNGLRCGSNSARI